METLPHSTQQQLYEDTTPQASMIQTDRTFGVVPAPDLRVDTLKKRHGRDLRICAGYNDASVDPLSGCLNLAS